MGALTRALTQSDLHDLKLINDGATKLSNSELYPYEPDFLVGYNGKKLGIFVLNDINVMRDSSKPDGETQRKMDLLEQYHKQGSGAQIKSVAIPISKVVDYDLANYQISLKEDFKSSQ